MKKVMGLIVCSFLFFSLLGLLRAGDFRGEPLPLDSNYEWNVRVQVYGTTDMPGKIFREVMVYPSGPSGGFLLGSGAKDADSLKIKSGSTNHREKLPPEDLAKIYEMARLVIQRHALDTKRVNFTKDGTSVAVSLGSYDKKITVTFDHNGHENSREYGVLRNLLNSVLPEGFKL